MSISMCENDGVPSVITMWRARAASATRSDSDSRPGPSGRVRIVAFADNIRSSSACAPVSWNGIVPSRTAPSRAGSLSIPTTSRPRSANDSASGRPTRPRPTTATSAVLCEAVIAA